MTKFERLKSLNIWALLLIILITGVGLLVLYSAAGGHIYPWAFKQFLRFFVGMVILLVVAVVDIRSWYNVAYPFYFVSLILVIGVELLGFVGMGAQRWLDLYIFNLQPSELMKVALVLALARYFHDCSPEKILKTRNLIIPLVLILIPALLMMRQPDLGTAMLLIFAGVTVFFLAGVQLWKFFAVMGLSVASFPVLWTYLHDYQKKRILVFLNPESDPTHSGYHVMQSKIALGSGGFWGKGFMQGSQSHLNFLPEKQTDFIFTMFCEEFGTIGAIVLLTLYTLLIIYCFSVALKSRNSFARLMALALTMIFFFYITINMAMVMGLAPVVGIPLPLVSYGGTSMLTVLFSFGLIFSTRLYHDVRFGGV